MILLLVKLQLTNQWHKMKVLKLLMLIFAFFTLTFMLISFQVSNAFYILPSFWFILFVAFPPHSPSFSLCCLSRLRFYGLWNYCKTSQIGILGFISLNNNKIGVFFIMIIFCRFLLVIFSQSIRLLCYNEHFFIH